jgi:adenosylmethionine-8-amino-7-oxononanoate aminotransferase
MLRNAGSSGLSGQQLQLVVIIALEHIVLARLLEPVQVGTGAVVVAPQQVYEAAPQAEGVSEGLT